MLQAGLTTPTGRYLFIFLNVALVEISLIQKLTLIWERTLFVDLALIQDDALVFKSEKRSLRSGLLPSGAFQAT